VVYHHPDHLGSASVLTDSRGTITGEMQYYPYGEIFQNSTDSSVSHLYTDQEKDEETELYYYGARYYDPRLASFLSTDPIIGDVYLPIYLNAYAPMHHNPVKLIDPDGLTPKDPHFYSLIIEHNKIEMGKLAGDMRQIVGNINLWRARRNEIIKTLDKLKTDKVADFFVQKVKPDLLNNLENMTQRIDKASIHLEIKKEQYGMYKQANRKAQKMIYKLSSPAAKVPVKPKFGTKILTGVQKVYNIFGKIIEVVGRYSTPLLAYEFGKISPYSPEGRENIAEMQHQADLLRMENEQHLDNDFQTDILFDNHDKE